VSKVYRIENKLIEAIQSSRRNFPKILLRRVGRKVPKIVEEMYKNKNTNSNARQNAAILLESDQKSLPRWCNN